MIQLQRSESGKVSHKRDGTCLSGLGFRVYGCMVGTLVWALNSGVLILESRIRTIELRAHTKVLEEEVWAHIGGPWLG